MTTHDIDALSIAVRDSDGSPEAQDALWEATFDAEHWVFLTRGTGINVAPYCGVIDGRPMVYAFTDDDRAFNCGQQVGVVSEDGLVPMVFMEPDGAIGWVEALAQYDVWGIIFNPMEANYFAPLGNLSKIHAHLRAQRLAG